MKIHKNATLLMLIVLSSLTLPALAQGQQNSSITIASSGKIDNLAMIGNGVNYNIKHIEWLTNETMERDFSRFEKDGLKVILLSLYWFQLEGNNRGDYNGTYPNEIPYGSLFLENVKRCIQIANQYDLKIMVGFHTLWNEKGCEWCTPDYVIDDQGANTQMAIVKDENMKQAFLDMVNFTVTYLKNEKIFAWSLLNEPWGESYAASFVDLIEEESTLVKSITNTPVTVKFISSAVKDYQNGTRTIFNHFTKMFNWNNRIFNALDFISLNCYIKEFCYNEWAGITEENINGIIQLNKNAYISEFGFNSDDDAIQLSYYQKGLEFFKNQTTAGLAVWCWNNYDLSELGKGYNLLKDNLGNPRLAYGQLVQFAGIGN